MQIFFNGRGVEQLAACRAHNPKVAGSSPAPATEFKTKNKFKKNAWHSKIICFIIRNSLIKKITTKEVIKNLVL